ncbi:MAG: glutathione S-transferase family protein [Deltaproteobacteria bacterium]|nr:MAG: glutathione S-transferase family protein [Deltaproteobacteria bacterium]
MKLYYAPQTRAGRPRWLLEELGVPYEIVPVDLAQGEHKKPEYMKIHPHGAVPALADGDLVLFESAAICMYLADKYPEKKLAPAVGTPARGLYYQWMIYTMATLEPPVVQIFLNTVMLPEAERSAAAVEKGKTQFAEVARVLSNALATRPYILGEQFSAADVMIGGMLGWASMMGLLSDQPTLQAYVKRVTDRPAFQRARS